jgi:serine/threonine-protein kinase TTK/MPS1
MYIFQVHADIKPDNLIMVNNVLKLTDLGLAFRMPADRPAARRPGVRGTLGAYSYLLYLHSMTLFILDYMAPEVFSRQTGFKSDVWSAGIILYEMTYGRPPYFAISDRNQKVAAISSMTPIPFAPVRDRNLFDCMKRCLHSNASIRPSAYQLKAHPYTRM